MVTIIGIAGMIIISVVIIEICEIINKLFK